jgi:hypothetical protein
MTPISSALKISDNVCIPSRRLGERFPAAPLVDFTRKPSIPHPAAPRIGLRKILPVFAGIFAVFSPKRPPFIAGCKKIFYNNREAFRPRGFFAAGLFCRGATLLHRQSIRPRSVADSEP